VQSTPTDDVREFRAPQTMTTLELGDSLARLVWESFSDFVAKEDVETPVPDVDTRYDDDGTVRRTAEEALIFFMWAHAAESDDKLGESVTRHLLGGIVRKSMTAAIRERAVAVANPLKDFLEDVELVEA